MVEYKNECEVPNVAGMSASEKKYMKYKHCLHDCDKCSEKQLLKKILYELRKLNKK